MGAVGRQHEGAGEQQARQASLAACFPVVLLLLPAAAQGLEQRGGVAVARDPGLHQRDFGLLRGTTALALTRTVYSDAELSDGTQVTLSDRDQTAGTWRGRIGYELSPAIIPFVEVNLGRAIYDQLAPGALEFADRLIAAIDPADREALDRILDRLMQSSAEIAADIANGPRAR